MFDPSKLNLDIDDSKKNIPASKEEIQNALKSVEDQKNITWNTEKQKSVLFEENFLKEEKSTTNTTTSENKIDEINQSFIKSEEKKIQLKI